MQKILQSTFKQWLLSWKIQLEALVNWYSLKLLHLVHWISPFSAEIPGVPQVHLTVFPEKTLMHLDGNWRHHWKSQIFEGLWGPRVHYDFTKYWNCLWDSEISINYIKWYSWLLLSSSDGDINVSGTIRSGWWFGTFFIFPNSWDDDPIWLIYFRGVETTN